MHKIIACICLFCALFMASGLSSQQQSPGAPPLSLPGSQDNNGPVIPDHMKKEMEKKANERRQADIRRDTERLVKLSTELKEYVDKSNENILSLDVIKKADEIEKLAHSVKTKMRGEN